MEELAKLKLEEAEAKFVGQLCAEFDPEQVLPPWMREHGDAWEAWMRVERHELRQQLEVAVLVGNVLEDLGNPWTGEPGFSWARDDEIRLQVFRGLAQKLTWRPEDMSDYDSAVRVGEHSTMEECDRRSDLLHDNCEAACRRALFIDRGPQVVAS